MDELNSKATSHKGEKVRSYSICYKLEAADYAKELSNHAAANTYKVDPHSIRDWRKSKTKLRELWTTVGSTNRKRLLGAGRKPFNEEMEESLLEWILQRRSKKLQVFRKIIMKKAKVGLVFLYINCYSA